MADLKLDLFIKLMRMTSSSNDGEALVALRKSEAMLRAANLDWEKLLRGKVTVVADPFNSIPTPERSRREAPPPPTAPRTYYNPPPRPNPPRRPVVLVDCFYCKTPHDRTISIIRTIKPSGPAEHFCSPTCHQAAVQAAVQAATTHARQPRNRRKVSINDLMFDDLNP